MGKALRNWNKDKEFEFLIAQHQAMFRKTRSIFSSAIRHMLQSFDSCCFLFLCKVCLLQVRQVYQLHQGIKKLFDTNM